MMQNENTDNTQQSTLMNETRQEVRKFSGELERVKESIDQTWGEARSTRMDLEQCQMELHSQRRRTNASWVMVLLLAAALAGISWYSYPMLKQYSAQLGQLPSVQDLLKGVTNRLSSAEAELTAWAAEREKLTDRMAKLEKRVSSNTQMAQNQGSQQTAAADQRMRTELNEGMDALRGRLAKVESAQGADRTRLDQLQNELVNARQEITGVREETSQQITKVQQDTTRDFSGFDRRLVTQKGSLDTLAGRIERQRIDFELPVNRAVELLPGINLTVSHTQVSHQRVDGWLNLASDGRILWVRGQYIQEPLSFYSKRDSRDYELVFTLVKDRGVAGYLLAPKGTVQTASAPTEEGSVASLP